MKGGLNDRIGFSVCSSYTMIIRHKMTNGIAMGQSRWRAIKTSCKYSFISNKNCTYLSTVACAASGNLVRNVYKISIPIWSHILRLYLLLQSIL
jgi:hypothetical protein